MNDNDFEQSENSSMHDFISAVIFCIRLSWGTSRLYTIIRVFVYIVNAILPLVSIYSTKMLLDVLADADGNNDGITNVLLLLCTICIITICSAGVNKLLQYIQSLHTELMGNQIQIELMSKHMNVDIEFFDSPNYIDAMLATMTDSSALPNIVWNIFYGLSSIISFTSAFIVLGIENWLYPVILTCTSFPSAIMNQRYTRVLYEWHLTHITEERKMSYIQSLTNNKVLAGDIRLFNLSEYLKRRYQDIWVLLYTGRRALYKRQLFSVIIASLLPEISVLGIIIHITSGIINGYNSVGDYVLYSALLGALVGSLTYLINSIVSIYEDKLKVDTVKKFLARENAVQDDGKMVLCGDMTIEFRNVSFKYPDTENTILRNLSFKIEPREKICLIGINGSGKSTIIKLLLRFYNVTEGHILINGADIREYSLLSLRRGFSTYFQQFDKYAFSLRDNIIISDLEHDEDDELVLKSLETAGALEIKKKAPFGLDTMLSRVFTSDGIELSGGEAQKVALARAIYRSCTTIILDEPSSSLDPVSEMAFYNSMCDYLSDKTALFTSHRLNIVHLADRILLLDEGRIKENGSHKELIALGGDYANLYMLQASKYEVYVGD